MINFFVKGFIILLFIDLLVFTAGYMCHDYYSTFKSGWKFRNTVKKWIRRKIK